MTEEKNLNRLLSVRPHPRQIRYQEREFIGFIHFTVNTFTNREWGDGKEDPALFNPDRLDCRQWARTAREAGMKGLILTARHHDGFCLWPSATTDHTVRRSPFRGGAGDVVRELSEACQAEGLEMGIYLSPWDRHSPVYGQGRAYDDVFVEQLRELLTDYGDMFCVWLDGACGEGPDGRKQVYDWERYYAAIRALQPMACICVCGPDIRWCGNERGDTRESEWSVVDARLRDAEKVAGASQTSDDAAFRERPLSSSEMDLGSREKIRDARELCWYPCEVNTSIRPGWFYHPEEDGKVRSADWLTDLYLRTVGGNATLLLNLPPDTHGLLPEPDVRVMKEMGRRIRHMFRRDLLLQEGCFPSWEEGGRVWQVRLPQRAPLGLLSLREDIREGQRVERFRVRLYLEGRLVRETEGTTVGSRRLVSLGETADRVEVRFEECRGDVRMRDMSVYEA